MFRKYLEYIRHSTAVSSATILGDAVYLKPRATDQRLVRIDIAAIGSGDRRLTCTLIHPERGPIDTHIHAYGAPSPQRLCEHVQAYIDIWFTTLPSN
ncbi:hypothetical protein AB0I84_21595 [Streptomyces spectabilis]|uniref:hypothetical protein n=1 Tax=Streptomyces spectabilis TaxID=68270 RepID=UPI0033F7B62D